MYVVYFITYNNNFSHTHTSNSVSSSFKTCPESEYFLSLLKPRPGSQHHLTDLGHCHGLLTGLSTSQPCSSLCCPSSQRNPALHCTDGTVMGEATRHRGGVRARPWPVHSMQGTLYSVQFGATLAEHVSVGMGSAYAYLHSLSQQVYRYFRAQLFCSGSVASGKLPNLFFFFPF